MAVAVRGLKETQRAFRLANKALADDMKDALEEAAAPVRSTAQVMALRISRVPRSPGWARMRIGSSVRDGVYVAPVERGIKGRGNQRKARPKFGTSLLERAMEPALEQNRGRVERRLEGLIDEVADVWERTSGP